jgi:hypothetical protein
MPQSRLARLSTKHEESVWPAKAVSSPGGYTTASLMSCIRSRVISWCLEQELFADLNTLSLVRPLKQLFVVPGVRCSRLVRKPAHNHFTITEVPAFALFATDFHVVTTEAIRYAALFAKTMNLPLHCLHVLPRGIESDGSGQQISSLITDALKHLVVGLDLGPLLPVCAVTYGSEISNTVVGYARSHHARLIVLGVRRASLAASQVPADIVYRIITDACCPVLTMAFPIEPEMSTFHIPEPRQPEVTTKPVIAA